MPYCHFIISKKLIFNNSMYWFCGFTASYDCSIEWLVQQCRLWATTPIISISCQWELRFFPTAHWSKHLMCSRRSFPKAHNYRKRTKLQARKNKEHRKGWSKKHPFSFFGSPPPHFLLIFCSLQACLFDCLLNLPAWKTAFSLSF